MKISKITLNVTNGTKFSIKDVVEGIASGIWEVAEIDLGGMLGSTVLGVYNWHESEERAIFYYEDF